MKLLKQNDNAGGLIFKQNQAGKAMKQNYNFGLKSAITNRAYFLEIPTLIGQSFDELSVSMWGNHNNVANPRYPIFFLRNADATIRLDVFEGMNQRENSPGFSNLLFAPNISFSTNYLSVNKSNSDTLVIDTLSIAKGGVRGNDGTTSEINELRIYSRHVSLVEANHEYNNRLGNDPLNTNQLICWIKFNNPIISGSDIIHFDQSGNNNHAVYKGLPAGTMEEKLVFVQDNLLTPA